MATACLKLNSCGSAKMLGRQLVLGRRLIPQIAVPLQVAFISGKALRDPSIKKPAPFPYKEKKFTYLRNYFEDTTHRFDENTKLIVVEGSIAAGKTTFAKQLAEQLDMLYLPEVTMDMQYINSYGHDVRDYKHLLPESVKPYDINDYYREPKHQNTGGFQISMYRLRFEQYVDALAHIMNTGQGVVLERCAYSDFCFLETMFKFGYVSRTVKDHYYEVRKNTIGELMQPHLVIYLDVPVNVIKERIKKRGIESELKTNVLTTEYLQTLADVYKYQYLKQIGKHAELLIYDWSNFGDVEVVVEDIERVKLELDDFDKYDTKMKDWRLDFEADFKEKRYLYTRKKTFLLTYFNVPPLDCPEMWSPSEDREVFWKVYNQIPGNKYMAGYNANMGDTGILFKTKIVE